MDFMAHPEEALHWGSQVFPSKSEFEAMVRSYLVNNMGIKLTKDANLMESLWFPDQSADQTHPGKPFFYSLFSLSGNDVNLESQKEKFSDFSFTKKAVKNYEKWGKIRRNR